MNRTFDTDRQLIEEHRRWLDQHGAKHRRSWENGLSNDPEGACCEAGFRRLLQSNGCAVAPNEKTNSKGKMPDFRCESPEGPFYFEATCVQIKTIVDKYSLSPEIRDLPTMEAFEENDIIPLFFDECRGKADQCAGMDAPSVLGIGTFHRVAGWISLEVDHVDKLLTGTEEFRIFFDPFMDGIAAGPIPLASLKESFVLRYGVSIEEVERARRSISAVVLAYPNLSVFDRVVGVIHPDAARPFVSKLLPNVSFRRLVINDAEGWCEARWDEGENT